MIPMLGTSKYFFKTCETHGKSKVKKTESTSLMCTNKNLSYDGTRFKDGSKYFDLYT